MAPTNKKHFSLEESLTLLETLVEQMESGNLSLEDALEAFEKGTSLIREAEKYLREAKQKIQILTGDTLEDFQHDTCHEND